MRRSYLMPSASQQLRIPNSGWWSRIWGVPIDNNLLTPFGVPKLHLLTSGPRKIKMWWIHRSIQTSWSRLTLKILHDNSSCIGILQSWNIRGQLRWAAIERTDYGSSSDWLNWRPLTSMQPLIDQLLLFLFTRSLLGRDFEVRELT